MRRNPRTIPNNYPTATLPKQHQVVRSILLPGASGAAGEGRLREPTLGVDPARGVDFFSQPFPAPSSLSPKRGGVCNIPPPGREGEGGDQGLAGQMQMEEEDAVDEVFQ